MNFSIAKIQLFNYFITRIQTILINTGIWHKEAVLQKQITTLAYKQQISHDETIHHFKNGSSETVIVSKLHVHIPHKCDCVEANILR